MTIDNKFFIGNLVYYTEVLNDKLTMCQDLIEAVLIEKGVLGKLKFSYLVHNKWKDEREIFNTEAEAKEFAYFIEGGQKWSLKASLI